MSDTEVDGQPGNVARGQTAVTESADVYHGGVGHAALVVVPLILGLFVAAGVGARMLLADIPDRSQASDPDGVVCWDGAKRPAKECGVPTGRAGLRWMFPSFKPSDPGCRDVLDQFPRSARPAMFACRVHAKSGSVTITYSQLTNPERGRRFLEKGFGFPPQQLDGHLGRRLLWTEGDDPGDAAYELAVMYAELPFAVEIRARSAAARDEALDKLVRFRPEDQASVRPDKPARD